MQFVCADGEPRYESVSAEFARLLRAAGHELRWINGTPESGDEWVERVGEADGILLVWSLPSGVLGRCPNVRVVSFTGTGVQRFVDMREAAAGGVTVCNVPSYASNAVAEHALALVFAVARRVPSNDRLVREGGWAQEQVTELRGRRLGVVGAGPIAARVIELGAAIGMEPVFWTRSRPRERERELGVPYAELPELFRTSDVVSIHLAHTPETEKMIDAELLSLLPRHAIFVNTARAELVDNAALSRLIEQRLIYGAGLDVFETEPPARDEALVRSERVVLSPHVANQTPEALRELFEVALGNLSAFAAGQPVNVSETG